MINLKKAREQLSDNEFIDVIRKRRQTGKTMSAAFEILMLALRSPDLPISIYDYEPYDTTISSSRNNIIRNVIPRLEHIINTLDLKGFVINKSTLTLTYILPYFEEKSCGCRR